MRLPSRRARFLLLAMVAGSSVCTRRASAQRGLGDSPLDEATAVDVPVLGGHWSLRVAPEDERYARALGRVPMNFWNSRFTIEELGAFGDWNLEQIAASDASAHCAFGVQLGRSGGTDSAHRLSAEIACHVDPIFSTEVSVYLRHDDGSVVAVRGREPDAELVRSVATRMTPGRSPDPETRLDRIDLALCGERLEFELAPGDRAFRARGENEWTLVLAEDGERIEAGVDAHELSSDVSDFEVRRADPEWEHVVPIALGSRGTRLVLHRLGGDSSFADEMMSALVHCSDADGPHVYGLNVTSRQFPDSPDGYFPSDQPVRRLLASARWISEPRNLRVESTIEGPPLLEGRATRRRVGLVALAILVLGVLAIGVVYEREPGRA